MSQLDLFTHPAPAAEERCGVCVHLNALAGAERGSCTPVGERLRDDPPCAWFFGLTQLWAPLYGRKLL
jgi:hypothetical protein